MELKDYLAILRRRWAVILVSFFALAAVFVGYLYIREAPSYAASAKIGVRDERRPWTPTDLQLVQFDAAGYGYFTKEALLSSKQVFDVGAAFYLAARERRELSDPKEARRWWRDPKNEVVLATWLKERKLVVEANVADESIREFTLADSEEINSWSEILIGSISISKPDERVQLIQVKATAGDTHDALLMANAYAKGAEVYSRVESRRLLQRVLDAVLVKKEPDEAQRQLLLNILGPVEELLRSADRRIAAITDHAFAIEREIEQTKTRKEQLEARIRTLSSSDHRERTAAPELPDDEGLTSALLERLRSEILSASIDFAIKAHTWTKEHPDGLRLIARIRRLDEEYRDELNRVRATTIRKLIDERADLDVAIENLEGRRLARVLELNDEQDRIAQYEPDRKKLERINQNLSKYDDLAVRIQSSMALQQGYYALEEAAGGTSASPTRFKNTAVLMIVLAALLSLGVGYLFEYIDSNIYTDYDVRRHLNMPCLSLVQDLKGIDPIILKMSPRDAFSELFNMTATMLRSYLQERQFKAVTVCSAIPREGKTMVSVNLAVALARKGLRVALVDGDLRIPQIHQIFSVDNGRGLSSILSGDGTEAADPEALFTYTEVEGLRVLPSGPIPENPGQLLDSPNMVAFVRALREKFDVVLFDSPPITSVGDTLTLARLVDTNVFVIGAGLSNRRMVTWAKQLLTNVRGDIAGAVLNFARYRGGSQYYYYYYYGGDRGKSVRSRT